MHLPGAGDLSEESVAGTSAEKWLRPAPLIKVKKPQIITGVRPSICLQKFREAHVHANKTTFNKIVKVSDVTRGNGGVSLYKISLQYYRLSWGRTVLHLAVSQLYPRLSNKLR